MTKNELASAVAKQAGVKTAVALSVIAALGDHINITVRSGEEAVFPGVGRFTRKTRDARTGRNPRTGETVQIASKRVVSFKPAKEFRDAVA